MGDRANVQFTETLTGQPCINLYGHWAGGSLAVAAQQALGSQAARARWSDPSYCTRIVIQQTLELCGAKGDEDHGFGIWFDPDDNEHNILVIQYQEGSPEGGTVSFGGPVWTFEEFCAMSPDVIRAMAG